MLKYIASFLAGAVIGILIYAKGCSKDSTSISSFKDIETHSSSTVKDSSYSMDTTAFDVEGELKAVGCDTVITRWKVRYITKEVEAEKRIVYDTVNIRVIDTQRIVISSISPCDCGSLSIGAGVIYDNSLKPALSIEWGNIELIGAYRSSNDYSIGLMIKKRF